MTARAHGAPRASAVGGAACSDTSTLCQHPQVLTKEHYSRLLLILKYDRIDREVVILLSLPFENPHRCLSTCGGFHHALNYFFTTPSYRGCSGCMKKSPFHGDFFDNLDNSLFLHCYPHTPTCTFDDEHCGFKRVCRKVLHFFLSNLTYLVLSYFSCLRDKILP